MHMLKKEAPTPMKTTSVTLSDEEILEKAHNATNGDKFKVLFDSGNIYQYESQSSDDLALMNMLAFYTKCDRVQMERLFGMSALGQRDKWQSRSDYRDMTISKAITDCTKMYEPVKKESATEVFSDWREPTPLDIITLPPFPLGCFPATIANYARELSEYTQTDPAMAGVSCLGILGGVFQNKIAVQSVNFMLNLTLVFLGSGAMIKSSNLIKIISLRYLLLYQTNQSNFLRLFLL